MKMFCPNCGQPIEYLPTQKPKFCTHCGGALSFSNTATANTNKTVVVEESEDYIETSPEMFKIEIVGGSESIYQKVKAETIVGTGKTGFSRPNGVFTPEKATQELRATAKTTEIEDKE